MADISDRLQAMLSSAKGDILVTVNVMLETNLTASQAESLANEVAAHVAEADNCEYLSNMKIVHCDVPLQTIRQLADLEGVVWIDLESHAPLEAIMDTYD